MDEVRIVPEGRVRGWYDERVAAGNLLVILNQQHINIRKYPDALHEVNCLACLPLVAVAVLHFNCGYINILLG